MCVIGWILMTIQKIIMKMRCFVQLMGVGKLLLCHVSYKEKKLHEQEVTNMDLEKILKEITAGLSGDNKRDIALLISFCGRL